MNTILLLVMGSEGTEKPGHRAIVSLNHELVLGRSYFKDKIEEMTKRQTRLGQPDRPRVEDDEGVYLIGF